MQTIKIGFVPSHRDFGDERSAAKGAEMEITLVDFFN
jgi:hypothetical protein